MTDKFHITWTCSNAGDVNCKNVSASSPEDAVRKVEVSHERRGTTQLEALVLRNSPSCPMCGSKTLRK
jgi:hypothetical protein